MRELVFTVKGDADAISSAIDLRLGYPLSGTDVGAGVHAPPAQSITVRYGNVIKHPVQNQWRYPHDAKVVAEEGKGLQVGASGSDQALDATWFPVGPPP